MKRLISLCFALAAITPAAARPASTAQTCAATRAMIASQGAVVMDTSPTTYDRFVRDGSFCRFDEVLRPAWAPTRDNPQCMIGYTCEQSLPIPMMRN